MAEKMETAFWGGNVVWGAKNALPNKRLVYCLIQFTVKIIVNPTTLINHNFQRELN